MLVVPDAVRSIGPLASRVHGHPSDDVDVVGVTGTDGKTTTTWLIAAALNACGVSTGVIGSSQTQLNSQVLVSDEPQHRRTTPEASDLQATLASLRDHSARAVPMEASSHGLSLGRTAGTRFAVGAFTNLGHDHLDFHGDMNAYFEAKAQLFDACDNAVINVDDVHGLMLGTRLRAAGRPVVSVSTEGASASWNAVDIVTGPRGTTFTALGPDRQSIPVRTTLSGRFNAANALMALAVASALGVPAMRAAAGMRRLPGVPGRMEWIVGGDVTALVDYAHTPGALAAMLCAARTGTSSRGRVVLVFGTGGERNTSKRPLMGAAAGAGADFVVLTDDNPRHENPSAIRAALRAGVVGASGSSPVQLYEVPDRREAVEFAVGLSRPGDVVVVAGKGSDRIQLLGDTTMAADDPAALRWALALRRQTA